MVFRIEKRLASTLNMKFVHFLQFLIRSFKDRTIFSRVLRDSTVRRQSTSPYVGPSVGWSVGQSVGWSTFWAAVPKEKNLSTFLKRGFAILFLDLALSAPFGQEHKPSRLLFH